MSKWYKRCNLYTQASPVVSLNALLSLCSCPSYPVALPQDFITHVGKCYDTNLINMLMTRYGIEHNPDFIIQKWHIRFNMKLCGQLLSSYPHSCHFYTGRRTKVLYCGPPPSVLSDGMALPWWWTDRGQVPGSWDPPGSYLQMSSGRVVLYPVYTTIIFFLCYLLYPATWRSDIVLCKWLLADIWDLSVCCIYMTSCFDHSVWYGLVATRCELVSRRAVN